MIIYPVLKNFVWKLYCDHLNSSKVLCSEIVCSASQVHKVLWKDELFLFILNHERYSTV